MSARLLISAAFCKAFPLTALVIASSPQRRGRRKAAVVDSSDSARLRPVIDGIRREGITSLRGVAAALNQRGMLTRRGGRWHVSNVRNLLGRLAE